jgi:serine/threonine protein kinase
MSPQILRQEKYTFATDMWSLGITIYFMVFQKLPWNSYKVIGILKEIEGGFNNIPESNISPLLRDLLQKMLMFEEADRITVEQALQHPYL